MTWGRHSAATGITSGGRLDARGFARVGLTWVLGSIGELGGSISREPAGGGRPKAAARNLNHRWEQLRSEYGGSDVSGECGTETLPVTIPITTLKTLENSNSSSHV